MGGCNHARDPDRQQQQRRGLRHAGAGLGDGERPCVVGRHAERLNATEPPAGGLNAVRAWAERQGASEERERERRATEEIDR